MMREWKHDLANGSDDNDDSAINGKSSSAKPSKDSSKKDEGVSSASSSRGNSAGSLKQGKVLTPEVTLTRLMQLTLLSLQRWLHVTTRGHVLPFVLNLSLSC